MAATSGYSSTESLNTSIQEIPDPLKQLYPAVNEGETPLPRSWSSKDKYNFIGLSQNNLRVHYKGIFFISTYVKKRNLFCLEVRGDGKAHLVQDNWSASLKRTNQSLYLSYWYLVVRLASLFWFIYRTAVIVEIADPLNSWFYWSTIWIDRVSRNVLNDNYSWNKTWLW